jgi:electron transport complex protein RnfD
MNVTVTDAIKAGATPLAELKKGIYPTETTITSTLIGNIPGCIGEISATLLILGGLYLLARKVITWHIPVSMIGGVFVLSFLLDGFSFQNALCWILSGGLFIGAFFMATDYVTSPATPKGKIIFGLGAAVITVLIRFYGGYPEGVSFAILLLNIINPYIEQFSNRKLFGGKKYE